MLHKTVFCIIKLSFHIAPDKALFFYRKALIFFLLLHENMFWVLIRSPTPRHFQQVPICFCADIRMWISSLIWSYDFIICITRKHPLTNRQGHTIWSGITVFPNNFNLFFAKSKLGTAIDFNQTTDVTDSLDMCCM